MNDQLEKLYLKHRGKVHLGLSVGQRVLPLLFLSYVVASTINASLIPIIGETAVSKRSRQNKIRTETVDGSNDFNHRDLRKALKTKNVFNSDGEFPDEEPVTEEDNMLPMVEDFDDKAPCKPTRLNIELLGTIYLGNTGASLATIKEKGYNIADVYREGDVILGQAAASVRHILQRKVVINNGGSKECLEKSEPKGISFGGGSQSTSNQSSGQQPSDDGDVVETEDYGIITLDADYVAESLGPNFSKILETGKLVPETDEDGKMVGFKLIAVQSGSLWERVKLARGDVIVSVNDISMTQPDQGFAIYQALSEGQPVRVSFLKGGDKPASLMIEIK